MPIIPKVLTSAFERVFFSPAMISEVKSLGDHFRLIELSGDRLKPTNWIPGQMVQFHLGNLTTRAYTPTSWDSKTGRARFLIFLHGNGPGSKWAASVSSGDPCQFIGPRDSLNFQEIKGPCVFFGDETSFAAAQALHHSRNGAKRNRYVFEVSSLAESKEILRYGELTEARTVQKTSDNTHLAETAEILSTCPSSLEQPQWIFTGKAQSIQALRNMLRAQGVLSHKIKVKAYWAEGKTGLD